MMTTNLLLCLLPILLTLVQCRCETRNEQELRRLRNVARTEVPATLKLLIDGNDAELKSLFLVNGQEVPGLALQGGQTKTPGGANVRQIGDSGNSVNPGSTQIIGTDGNPQIMNDVSLPTSGIGENSNGYYFTNPLGGYTGLGGNQFIQFPGYGAGGQWGGENGGVGGRVRPRLRRFLGRILGGSDSSPLGLGLRSRNFGVSGAGGEGGGFGFGGGPSGRIGSGRFGGMGLGGRGSGWGSGILGGLGGGGSRFGLGGGNGGLGSGWLQGLGLFGGNGGGRGGYGILGGDGIGVQSSDVGGGAGIQSGSGITPVIQGQSGGGVIPGVQGYRGGVRPGGELGISGIDAGDLQGFGTGRVRPGGGLSVLGGDGGDIGSGGGRIRPGVGLGVLGDVGGDSQVLGGGRGRPGVGFTVSEDGGDNGLEFIQGNSRGPRKRYGEIIPGNNGDSVSTVTFNGDGVGNSEPGRANRFGLGVGNGGLNYSPDSVSSMSWKTSPSDLIYTYGDQIEPINGNSNSNANYQLVLDEDNDDSEEVPISAAVQNGEISTNLDTSTSVQPNSLARDVDMTTTTSTSTTDPNGKRSRQYRVMVMNNGGSGGGDQKSGQGLTSSWTSMLPGSNSGSQGFQITSPLTEASKTITNVGTPGSSLITSTSGSSVTSDPSGTLNKIIRLIPIGNNNS